LNNDLAPLFQPFAFGRTMLANRIVMAPMTRRQSPRGVPGENVAAYYRRRAAGGVGLIITEGTTIDHPGAPGHDSVPAFHGEAALTGWRRVVAGVHEEGGAIIPQIWHVGMRRRPGSEPDPDVGGFGPMDIVEDGQLVVKAMTQADIDAVVAAYAKAAGDAEAVGFDGVEIHGAHQYLPDAFFWEVTNQRSDGYGGSLENRVRFAVEVVRAVRAAVSKSFPVVFRFSQWKLSDYNARIATTPDELGRILRPLAEAGVDVFHASTRRFWEPAFEGSKLTLAAWTRELTGRPVIAVGSIGLDRAFVPGIPSEADKPGAELSNLVALSRGIARGDFDLAAVGRALLSEPDWANKLRDGLEEQIRPFERAALESLVV
jgi:2,4-dienoyl-CoA reductase-like NADH-dependent reductase (Old Yellow Enzyme family)